MRDTAWGCLHHACLLVLAYSSFISLVFTEASIPLNLNKVSSVSSHQSNFSSLTSASSTSFTSRLTQWHLHYCGYNRVCKNYSPSLCYRCAPCRCDKICHRYGDCCPDVAVRSSGEPNSRPFTGKYNSRLECHAADVPSWRLTDKDKKHQLLADTKTNNVRSPANRYFMVSRCPSNSPAGARRCEEAEGEPPVTSVRDPSIVFKNVECAVCHGVHDVTVWGVHVICDLTNDASLKSMKSPTLSSFIEKGCNLLYSPPVSTTYRHCYSNTDMVSQCNTTGKWITYSDFIARACDSYLTPKYAKGKLYKNIFCYLCNQEDGSFDPDLGKCARDPMQENSAFEGKLSSQNTRDVASLEAYIHDTGLEPCEQDGVYDPQQRKCREVSCDFGQRFDVSTLTCKPAFDSVKGLTYELYFKLKPEIPMHLSDKYDYLRRLPGEMELLLRRKLKGNKVNIEDFTVAFNTTSEGGGCGESTNDLALFARVTCQSLTNQSSLQKKLLSLRNDTFHVSTRRWTIKLQSIPSEVPWHLMVPPRRHSPHSLPHCTTIVANDLPKRRKGTGPGFGIKRVGTTTPDPVKVKAKLTSPPEVRVSNLLSCPHVSLLPSEYVKSGADGKLMLTWQNKILSENDYLMDLDGNVTVCLSHFISKLNDSILRRTSTEVLCSNILLPISILCLLLCLLCYATFPALRTLAGKNNMVLVMCLALTQISILTGYLVPFYSAWCTAMGILCHYFSLCLMLSLVICLYNLYTIFSTMHLTVDITKETKMFILYSCCIFIIPLIVVSAVILVSKFSDHFITSTGYGSGALCFLASTTVSWVTLFLPLIFFVAVAVVLFLLTYSALQSNADVETNTTDERHVHFYFRMSLIVLVAWTFCVVAQQTGMPALRIVFIALQCVLGVYVFIALSVNQRVAGLVAATCFPRSGPARNTSLQLHTVSSKGASSKHRPSVITTGYRQKDSPKVDGKNFRDSREEDCPDDFDKKSHLSNDGYSTIETIA